MAILMAARRRCIIFTPSLRPAISASQRRFAERTTSLLPSPTPIRCGLYHGTESRGHCAAQINAGVAQSGRVMATIAGEAAGVSGAGIASAAISATAGTSIRFNGHGKLRQVAPAMLGAPVPTHAIGGFRSSTNDARRVSVDCANCAAERIVIYDLCNRMAGGAFTISSLWRSGVVISWLTIMQGARRFCASALATQWQPALSGGEQ